MFNWLKILVSQFSSTIGTTLCEFALLVWVYDKTNSSESVSVLLLSFLLPKIIISPFAAYLVDRANRKLMLLISEIGEIVVCLVILMLHYTNNMYLWVVVCVNLLVGFTESFRFPAYSVITTSLLEKKQYSRAHGLYMAATSVPTIICPSVSAYLYNHSNIAVIYFINLITLIISTSLIVSVKINDTELSENKSISLGDGIRTLKSSIMMVFSRKEVMYMLMICAGFIFSRNAIDVILPVSIMSTYKNGVSLYGNIETIIGIGGLVGAIIVSFIEIRRLEYAFSVSVVISYIGMFIVSYQDSILACAVGVIVFTTFSQLMDACCQSWWQINIPIKQQGQVFAIRRFIIWVFGCFGTVIAGFADDFISIFRKMNYNLYLFSILCLFGIISVALINRYLFWGKKAEEYGKYSTD